MLYRRLYNWCPEILWTAVDRYQDCVPATSLLDRCEPGGALATKSEVPVLFQFFFRRAQALSLKCMHKVYDFY